MGNSLCCAANTKEELGISPPINVQRVKAQSIDLQGHEYEPDYFHNRKTRNLN